ncbi:acetyl-CoA carboxylase biotin carboxyl carrier protein [Nonomuraea sp. CA-141351]|uniref:acetyl-CoA carboxylase biotin carboxyl carrier protein n=1 Tax=Nonomuraea sp. CA-141351 TaxID=3239996 RepID=UPI003D8E2243
MGEPSNSEALRLLREEVSRLVMTVPGPMASVSVRAGECALEVTWAHQTPAPAVQESAPPPPLVEEPPDALIKEVVAPVVGTFYLAPEPGAPRFVHKGDRVEPGQTVGIVEAMKLMNPVTSEWVGEVVEVLIGNAEPVEFGQALVRIRKDEP